MREQSGLAIRAHQSPREAPSGGRIGRISRQREQIEISGRALAPLGRAAGSNRRRVAVSLGAAQGQGKQDDGEDLTSVTRYNPDADAWEAVANLRTPRSGLAAVTLGGKIYALGGFSGAQIVNTVERYDFLADIWEEVAPMATPRQAFAAVAMEGKIYAVGGHDGARFLNTIERYDPLTDTWEEVVSMTTARGYASAVAMVWRP